MHADESILVVIPARGGSRRIPGKNVKQICGQSMIYWPLMELKKCFEAENIIVSTDSLRVKSVVEQKGLSVPFIRPQNLSDDFTGTVPVVTHALNWFEGNVKPVDFVLTIYPTAVFLDLEDIFCALNILREDPNCDTAMSAMTFPYPIQRAVYENSEGYAEMFDAECYHMRSQDLVEAKHDAGQFYLSRSSAVRRGALLTDSNVKLCTLKRGSVVDIDTPEDFDLAEARLSLLKKKELNRFWSF